MAKSCTFLSSLLVSWFANGETHKTHLISLLFPGISSEIKTFEHLYISERLSGNIDRGRSSALVPVLAVVGDHVGRLHRLATLITLGLAAEGATSFHVDALAQFMCALVGEPSCVGPVTLCLAALGDISAVADGFVVVTTSDTELRQRSAQMGSGDVGGLRSPPRQHLTDGCASCDGEGGGDYSHGFHPRRLHARLNFGKTIGFP